MSDKSFVTLEQSQCPVCGKCFDTGSLLLDRRLRETFERHTVTGIEMCPECKKLRDDGYIALVEIDPARSQMGGGLVKPEDAWRTGRKAHIREAVWSKVFPSLPVPPKGLAYIGPGVIESLQAMMPDSGNARPPA